MAIGPQQATGHISLKSRLGPESNSVESHDRLSGSNSFCAQSVSLGGLSPQPSASVTHSKSSRNLGPSDGDSVGASPWGKSKFFSEPGLQTSTRPSQHSNTSVLDGLRHRTWIPADVRLILMRSGPPDEDVTASTKRELLAVMMKSNLMEILVAVFIFLNFILLMIETDSNALGNSTGSTPHWVEIMMHVCYAVFLVELCLRVYADTRNWPKEVWNWVDAFIVFTGTLEYVCTFFEVDVSGFSILRILRLFRLLRLMRVLRLFAFLKELRTLLSMMGTCFKTLFWSFLLLMIVMSIWAIIAVELLNPLLIELADTGTWSTCSRCKYAFSSVFMANLTFFQTTVAADSWGQIAVPVIEAYPTSAPIFIGAMLTLLFGILNLILAVVVDTCAQNREKDISAKSAEIAEEELQQKKELKKMFMKIDNDDSNAISWEELRDAAIHVREFRQWLRVMDIDARDLRQLFDIVDEDGSGEIDAEEFIDAMYRMRNADPKTASKFAKHIVTKVAEDQQVFSKRMDALFTRLEKEEANLQQKLHLQELAVQDAIENAMKRSAAVTVELLSEGRVKASQVSADGPLRTVAFPAKSQGVFAPKVASASRPFVASPPPEAESSEDDQRLVCVSALASSQTSTAASHPPANGSSPPVGSGPPQFQAAPPYPPCPLRPSSPPPESVAPDLPEGLPTWHRTSSSSSRASYRNRRVEFSAFNEEHPRCLDDSLPPPLPIPSDAERRGHGQRFHAGLLDADDFEIEHIHSQDITFAFGGHTQEL